MSKMEALHGSVRLKTAHLANGHRPVWRKLVGRALKLSNDLRWRALPPDYDTTHLVRANGYEIAVLPTVFHPRWHFTTLYFASQCPALVHAEGAAVLEVGMGTGVVAISVAARAARVVATDLNPVSVSCARMNVLNNGLAGKVEVYQGDMFEPVAGERFDLILCNPPYFRGAPRTAAELAYMAGDGLEWIERFAREAPHYLSDRGSVACVLGGAADLEAILSIFDGRGWSRRLVAEKDLLVEHLYVWQFRKDEG